MIATGVTTTIRDFIRMSAAEIGLEISFVGEGVDEKGFLTGINEQLFAERVGEQYLDGIKSRLSPSPLRPIAPSQVVGVDPSYFRPTEVELLIGDPSKAMNVLGWKREYDLKGLVEDMMQSDIKLMKKDAWLREGGYRTLNYFE